MVCELNEGCYSTFIGRQDYIYSTLELPCKIEKIYLYVELSFTRWKELFRFINYLSHIIHGE